MGDSDEAAIAEFHAAARRRNVKIFAVAAGLCIVIGVLLLVVAVTATDAIDQSGGRFESRTYLYSGALVVAGLGFAVKAWKTHRGEQVD